MTLIVGLTGGISTGKSTVTQMFKSVDIVQMVFNAGFMVQFVLLTLLFCAVTEQPWRWWVAGVPAIVLIVAGVAPQWKITRK